MIVPVPLELFLLVGVSGFSSELLLVSVSSWLWAVKPTNSKIAV
jgi:hypothetical protein